MAVNWVNSLLEVGLVGPVGPVGPVSYFFLPVKVSRGNEDCCSNRTVGIVLNS